MSACLILGLSLEGVQAYQELWRRYAPFFQGNQSVQM